MRFAEVFLRLAVALVGWLVVIAYLLWIAILPQTPCTAGETSLWLVLLYTVPVVLAFIAMLNAPQRMPAIHEPLRWLAVPAVLLTLLASRTLFNTFVASTLGEAEICGITTQVAARLWAPAHCMVLMMLAFQYWRGKPRKESRSNENTP